MTWHLFLIMKHLDTPQILQLWFPHQSTSKWIQVFISIQLSRILNAINPLIKWYRIGMPWLLPPLQRSEVSTEYNIESTFKPNIRWFRKWFCGNILKILSPKHLSDGDQQKQSFAWIRWWLALFSWCMHGGFSATRRVSRKPSTAGVMRLKTRGDLHCKNG